MESKFHTFAQPIQSIPLPERFTYPFHYTPHPLCVIAAEETQAYLKERTEWREELQTGKMFGVLVVRTPAGEVGYLAAFSGNLAGKNVHPFFVPPIYDLLQPDGFFRQGRRGLRLSQAAYPLSGCHRPDYRASSGYGDIRLATRRQDQRSASEPTSPIQKPNHPEKVYRLIRG